MNAPLPATQHVANQNLDPATLEAAADVVRHMSEDKKYWGTERNLLRVVLKRLLALKPDEAA